MARTEINMQCEDDVTALLTMDISTYLLKVEGAYFCLDLEMSYEQVEKIYNAIRPFFETEDSEEKDI